MDKKRKSRVRRKTKRRGAGKMKRRGAGFFSSFFSKKEKEKNPHSDPYDPTNPTKGLYPEVKINSDYGSFDKEKNMFHLTEKDPTPVTNAEVIKGLGF